MKIKGKKIFPAALLLVFIFCLASQASAQAGASSKILFVPLDDRPPTYQWVLKMGEIGDAEVVAPPRQLLGKFTEFGKSDAVIEWLKKQNLNSFDAAVISIDMLAYGGLVAMREFQTDEATALKRLEFIRELKRREPRMKIYASSVMMRLAPTGNVVNESYRENLARWAEISVDGNLKKETLELERKIPAEALANYKAARVRDLKINLAAVRLVEEKILEQLILGQDDAKPKGVHVADRERLIMEVKNLNLQSKIGIQPGADELSMLQLARALSDKYNYRPKIKAVYSSEKIRNQVMPYEDRPLHQTVSFQIRSVGAIEVESERDADILFYVYASRLEPGRGETFAEEIRKNFENVREGYREPKFKAKNVIIADVDPKGDVQGADKVFTEALKNKMIFQKTLGYAAWNTAGNTVGTALPHGMIYGLSKSRFKQKSGENPSSRQAKQLGEKREKIVRAQTWFLLNRILDDYVFHSIVRPEAQKFARGKGWNVFRFNPRETKAVEDFIKPLITGKISENLNRVSPLERSFAANLICEGVNNFSFVLPWDRTFEAEINFDLNCRKYLELQKSKKGIFVTDGSN